jgi:hypothetical protein
MEVSNNMIAIHFERLALYKEGGMDKPTKQRNLIKEKFDEAQPSIR